MRFGANEHTLPRLHLIGTLSIVLLLTVALGGYFSWRTEQTHRESLQQMAQIVQGQQNARLIAELDTAMNFLAFTRARTDTALKKSLREQLDTAMQIALAIHTMESPRKNPDDVKRLILQALRPVRFFEDHGYYFIGDMQGKVILMPTAPQLEGSNQLDIRDDNGRFVVRSQIEAARKPTGQGYTGYRWFTLDDPNVMADKLSYVRHFAPFDWLIGTGDYTHNWEQVQKQAVLDRLQGLKFGQSGYIGLLDRSGHSLLSPSDAALEGLHYQNMPAAQSAAVAQLLAKAREGGGFVHYAWPDRASGRTVNKTAMVRLVEPWGWVMLATMQDDDMLTAVQQEQLLHFPGAHPRWLDMWLPLLLALTFGAAASWGFARWLRRVMQNYHADMLAKNQVVADSEALFHAVFDNAAVGIAQVAPDGRFLQINQQFCRLIGYSRDEVLAPGFDSQKITFPDDLSADLAQVQRLLDGQDDSYQLEKRYLHKDGSAMWVNLAVHLVRDALGVARYFVSAAIDMTGRKQAEKAQQLAASVFSHAREGIMITAVDGTIINVNAAFTRITGYSREEVIGKNPRLLESGRHSSAFYAVMWQNINTEGHWYGEIWNRRKNGDVYAEMQTISAVRDAQGDIMHFVSLFTDITALKEHEQQLEHLAHFDALTNLPNRVLLADRLHQAMHNVQRHAQFLAVAYLDLDGFKQINDSHTHDAGDQLLMAVAARMKQVLREGDTLARIGGDEFVAVLVDLPDAAACAPLLNRLLAAAHEPLLLDGHTLQVSASLGVTFYPQADEIDADQLQRQADQAMYQAKLSGKNRYRVFDAEQDRSVRGHHESLARIHHAMTHGELLLHYQPKVNMRTGAVIGAEALIRWQHPEQGLLAPAMFLPVIENHPLAEEVGEWVLHTALIQMQAWHAAGLRIPVSVNVGARQLQQRDFVARLKAILARHPAIDPSCLELEVLETSALEDIAGVSAVINQCRQIGVMFALDDFGTGYSSLTYLKRLPVTLLKIDQSFVRDMLNAPDDLAILQGVIGLARAFKRGLMAEGVEKVEQGAMLLQLGCELAQGHGIACPMPGPEVPGWAQRWRPDPAWTGVK